MASVIVKVNGVNKVVEAESVAQVKEVLNLSKYTLRTKSGDVLTESSPLSEDMIIIATQNVASA